MVRGGFGLNFGRPVGDHGHPNTTLSDEPLPPLKGPGSSVCPTHADLSVAISLTDILRLLTEDILFDPEGNWLKSGENDDFVLERTIPIEWADEGTYSVKFTQFTRREDLCDVKSVVVR